MARRVEADETCGRGMWRVGGAHPPNALRNRIASSSCGEEVGSDGAARHRLTFGLLSPTVTREGVGTFSACTRSYIEYIRTRSFLLTINSRSTSAQLPASIGSYILMSGAYSKKVTFCPKKPLPTPFKKKPPYFFGGWCRAEFLKFSKSSKVGSQWLARRAASSPSKISKITLVTTSLTRCVCLYRPHLFASHIDARARELRETSVCIKWNCDFHSSRVSTFQDFQDHPRRHSHM